MEEIAAWINRTGIVFQFIAFVFAAPEILRDEKLEEFFDNTQVPIFFLLMTLPIASVGVLIYMLFNEKYTIVFSIFSFISVLLSIGAIGYIPVYTGFKRADDYIKNVPPRKKYFIYGAYLFAIATFLQLGASFWM